MGKLIVNGGKVNIPFIKTVKPNLTNTVGKVWEEGTLIIENQEVVTYIESKMGNYIYFLFDEQWYKIKAMGGDMFRGTNYTINTIGESITELTLK